MSDRRFVTLWSRQRRGVVYDAPLTRRDPYTASCTVHIAEVSASNRRRWPSHLAGIPARAAVIASLAAAAKPVQPHPEECLVSRMVATDADGGQRRAAGALRCGEHRAGRLGDLDYDPAREGRSGLALGQHPQADQGRHTARSMLLYLVDDGHGR